MIENEWLFLIYLLAGCLFILSIRGLSSPQTASRGNWLGMAGMLLAVDGTLLALPAQNHLLIFAALLSGGVVGLIGGLKVKITALPQMIAILNGLGGLSSALIGLAEILDGNANVYEVSVALFVGGAACSGSLVAFGKLQSILGAKFGRFPLQNFFNILISIGLLCTWIFFITHPSFFNATILLCASLAWGILIILPIGGADMPIIIAVLNACSGWAAAGIGFSLANVALIMTGALVGAGGTILAFVMTKAMNRSLWAVMFTRLSDKTGALDLGEHEAKSGSPIDAAFILQNAHKVIIVPGYGMAVAQAQHILQTMASILSKKYNVEVKFAIHPVAGRMPGHMNVLLAEANVPYEDVYALENINREFASADAAYVIGANDITNPLARTDPASPLYGMPVLDVGKAKTVFFVKRSLNSGYAGVENPLFYAPNTIMLYGDAKKVTEEIVEVLERS